MTATSATSRTGVLLALCGASLWGTTGTSQALLVGDHTPVAVGALRATIATAALLVVALGRRGGVAKMVQATHEGRWKWLLVGGAGVGFYQLAFFAAVAKAGVGVGTLVMLATAPLVAGLTGWLVLHDRPARLWWISTFVGLAGAALLVLGSSADRRVNWVGLALAVVAGACFGLYTISGRMTARAGTDGLALTTWVFLIASLLLAVPLARQNLAFLGRPQSLLVLVWLGVVATALAYLLFQTSMRHIPAATAATLGLAEPTVANILAVVVLHEPFTWLMGLGVVLVLGSLALLGRA